MDSPTATSEEGRLPGLPVLHLFYGVRNPLLDRTAVELAIKECQQLGNQVLCAQLLGHKADLAVMALGPSFETLRALQSALDQAGAQLQGSYVSLTELSEYAAGVPEAHRQARLRPELPPADMPAYCFYPMSKRRTGGDNWYRLPFDERVRLMGGHGQTGRRFRGRVVQLITGSTGLDDYEWGVTLFARTLEDVKDCVYEMRFDEASARFAEFGPFYVGLLGSPESVLDALGVGR